MWNVKILGAVDASAKMRVVNSIVPVIGLLIDIDPHLQCQNKKKSIIFIDDDIRHRTVQQLLLYLMTLA